MTVLDKYIVREVLRYFFMVLILVVIIYVLVDFFEKIGTFMDAGLPFSSVVVFYLNTIPFILWQIMPAAILLSVLISFGMMNKHNELLAVKSCGISIYKLIKPVLALGFIFTIILFFLAEAIVPVTMTTANRIWLNEARKEKLVTTRENNIWMRTTHSIIHIQHFNPVNNTVYKVTENIFDDRFRLVRRIDADHGVFKNGQWILSKILEQTLDAAGSSYVVTYHDTMPVKLDITPDKLKQVVKKSSEMNINELFDYIHTIESEGYPATRLWVDFHAKIAFPFVCVILVLVGMGIACKKQMKDGLPAGIAYGIGTAFLYWVINSFCMSLGYGEMLPPFIAAWTTNVIFLCFGILMLMHAEQL